MMPFIQQSSIKAYISKEMLYFVQDLDCEIMVRAPRPPGSSNNHRRLALS